MANPNALVSAAVGMRSSEDPRIRLVEVPAAGQSMTIGARRNWGCTKAAGNIIAHWDDDDFSAPARIEHQVRLMVENDRLVSGFNEMQFVDFESGEIWLYRGGDRRVLGTSLVYAREFWKRSTFPDMQEAEEQKFYAEALNRRELHISSGVGFMEASIHADNTSKRALWAPNFTRTGLTRKPVHEKMQ